MPAAWHYRSSGHYADTPSTLHTGSGKPYAGFDMTAQTDDYFPEVLTSAEVAATLRCGEWLVQKMCREGEFDGAFRVGRLWRIPRQAVLDHMKVGPSPAERRRELLGDDTIEFLQQLAASAPPLSEAQRDLIRGIFAGGDA